MASGRQPLPDGTGRPASARVGLILALALALAGCAGQTPPPKQAPIDPPAPAPKDKTAATPPAAQTQETAPAATPLVTTLQDGSVAILRPALKQLVARGAQHFIGLVDVRPAFRKKRFLGWRVVGYRGPGELRRGDIVVSINGRSVERPDQFIKVWNGLPSRDVFVAELRRRGKRVRLTYPIIDR